MGKNYKCWYSIYWRRNITSNNDICSFCLFQLSCISYFLSRNYFLHWPKKKKTWMEELSVNKSSSKLLDTIISTPIISLTIGRTEKWFGPFLSNFSRSIQICNWILDKKKFLKKLWTVENPGLSETLLLRSYFLQTKYGHSSCLNYHLCQN